MNFNLQTQTFSSTSTTSTNFNFFGTITNQLFLILALLFTFSATGYASSNTGNEGYFEMEDTYTNKQLTIKNNGSCTVRVYQWLATGDIFKEGVLGL